MSDSVGVHWVDCGKSLEVARCREFRDSLKSALDSGQDVVLDVSSIERVDAAGLQLLFAFYRKAEQCQRAIRWHEPSHTFQRSARLVDLARHLKVATDAARE